jgi:hypothetical protein
MSTSPNNKYLLSTPFYYVTSGIEDKPSSFHNFTIIKLITLLMISAGEFEAELFIPVGKIDKVQLHYKFIFLSLRPSCHYSNSDFGPSSW